MHIIGDSLFGRVSLNQMVSRRRADFVSATALVALLTSCTIYKRQVKVPTDDVPTAMVLSFTLMHPLDSIARHAWFAVRDKGEKRWERWEIGSYSRSNGPHAWGHVRRNRGNPLYGSNTRVHGIIRGDTARRFIKCLRAKSPRYEHRNLYVPWPGPNSNTYVDTMMRRCGFRADLPSTAIGKDHRGWLGLSLTSGGTGVQLETPLVGVRIGLTEGIQIHVFGLTIGIDWWPPAIIVPVGEGRIGFADR